MFKALIRRMSWEGFCPNGADFDQPASKAHLGFILPLVQHGSCVRQGCDLDRYQTDWKTLGDFYIERAARPKKRICIFLVSKKVPLFSPFGHPSLLPLLRAPVHWEACHLYPLPEVKSDQEKRWYFRYCSVVEHLPTMPKASGSVPSTA